MSKNPFGKAIKPKNYNLPVRYDPLSSNQRREVRLQYVRQQSGQCYYCEHLLAEEPREDVRDAHINWALFPENFLDHPVHLHHDHESGLTIGAVHARCNAYLWEHEGE